MWHVNKPRSFYESIYPSSAYMYAFPHVWKPSAEKRISHCNLFMMVKCPRLSTQ